MPSLRQKWRGWDKYNHADCPYQKSVQKSSNETDRLISQINLKDQA